MKQRTRLAAALGGVLASLVIAGTAPAQGRVPNIVVIVGDDMGYADVGVHGAKDIPTPNLDALAASGTRCSWSA